MKYLAYFQAYTNTYDTIDRLLARYYEALDFPGVEGLIISTRPDCMPEELLSELEKIAKNRLLLVEYGIESTDNQTLNYINRCHTFEDAVDCIERTYRRGIFCGVHIILGLPGETREMIVSHAVKISGLPLTTVKIHQLQVIRGTAMERQYHTNPELFHFFTVEEYIALCIDFLCHLNPNFYIDRFVSQSPAESLIVPGWGLKNHEFTVKLNAAIASV
jgi:radical SAM protein (TIGR01212 family)